MTPNSNGAPYLTWIYLLVGSIGLGLHADPSMACTTVVFETNQELFRKAVLVYEGVALELQHHFAVERVWRGPHRETVALTWPIEHLDSCEGHQATVVGKRYLLPSGVMSRRRAMSSHARPVRIRSLFRRGGFGISGKLTP